ncbi:hypothetical protein SLEP1_g47948 [Rubroshorea leprosula]|uniref:PGG domain-containing protein n=1 Tax=Rubroshorea leprosula TaxID=152421 RepID=A0AAV5LS43_9ROSI|nr:hypothetical protein SLEP1_g47948 [Rubroshorea leprosula]
MTTEVALVIDEESVEEMRELYVKALEKDRANIKTLYQTKHCALFDPLTPCGDTVFHIAAYMGSIDLLGDLFGMVAMPRKCEVFTMKNSHGNTLLHEVVMSNDVEAAKFLVDKIGHEGQASMLMDRNNLGETALYRAAAFGNKATVEYLVKKVECQQGNLKDDHFTRTSDDLSILHIAIMNEKFETAIWLLDKDPELATKKCSGKTSLHILASMPTAFKSSSSIMYGLEIIYRYIPEELVYRDETEQDVQSSESGIRCIHIPGNLVDGDETKHDVPSQSSETKICCVTRIKNTCVRKYHDLWTYLAERWKLIKEIGKTKKKHETAVKLAKMLVKMDSCSWREHYNEEGHKNIVCFSGDEETGEPLSQAICVGTTAKMLVKMDSSTWREHCDEEGHNIIICFSGDRKKGGKETGEPSSQTGCDGTAATIGAAPDTPLIIAARTGIKEIVAEIINVYPQALEHVTRSGQNILHVAILHRNHILDLIKSERKVVRQRLNLGIDNEGDTILHKAASTKYYSGGTTSTAALKLQEELRWFREVEKMVPLPYTIHLNKKNLTAKQLLKDEHKEQLKEAQEWVKNTSQSCSTVAILVATVLFAAVFAVPGGFIGYGDAKDGAANAPAPAVAGTAVLANEPLYSFFTVMDVAGLASSLTSVVLFLSVLTSSLDLEEFHYQIPSKLSAGFLFLSFAIATTLFSFTAATLLTFRLESAWTTSLTYAAAFLPVSIYGVVQFGLYFAYLKSALIGIFRLVKLLLPGK